jgi:hypothetical protein
MPNPNFIVASVPIFSSSGFIHLIAANNSIRLLQQYCGDVILMKTIRTQFALASNPFAGSFCFCYAGHIDFTQQSLRHKTHKKWIIMKSRLIATWACLVAMPFVSSLRDVAVNADQSK